MINLSDVEHLSKDEQIKFLLSALHASESQNKSLNNEVAKLASDLSNLAAKTAQRLSDAEAYAVKINEAADKKVADVIKATDEKVAEITKTTDKKIAEITEASNKKIKELEGKLERLIEQIKLMNMRYFGSKSEKVIPNQLSLFNSVEFASDPKAPEPALEDVLPKEKTRRRGGKWTIDFSKYETIVINHEIPEEKRSCPECGCTLEEMNVEVTRRIKLVPAHLVVEEHRRHVYLCKDCCNSNAKGEDAPSVIVRAPQPAPPIQGSFATPSLIAYVINGKYVNSLPLYRMENEFRMLGINLSRQTQANWVMNVHERWLSKIHERMKAELLSHDLAHADETVVQVLKEPNREAYKQSRMWLFCAAECDTPVFIYEYHETREKKVAQNFFAGWSGTLTTDGYAPYFNLGNPGIKNVACGVHIRRYFAQIVKNAGRDAVAEAAGSVALIGRRKIDEIFAMDSHFEGLSAEERRIAREQQLRPLMEEFYKWAKVEVLKATPKLALHNALNYAITYWPYLMNVLDDGRLVLSNNIAERDGIKPFVIGRKNFLFSDTPRGAHASAGIYSVVRTAMANGLNPRLYIEWLLDELPNAGNLTDEILDTYLPWSEKVPQKCKLSEGAAKNAKHPKDDPIVDIDPSILDDEMVNNENDS